MKKTYDIAIVGSGLAGLTCAKRLQELGFCVVILEKSRGLGGRVATRRLYETWVDHGLPYLSNHGSLTEKLIQTLCEQKICHLWSDTAYVSETGLNAIAKFLATDLEIWRSCRVTHLAVTDADQWTVTLETEDDCPSTVTAKIVVLAIPAPQALMLIESSAIPELAPSFIKDLASVTFNPCLAVMASYDPSHQSDLSQFHNLRIDSHADLSWISLESSKKSDPQKPVFIIHSSPSFAQNYLDTLHLEAAGQQLLKSASEFLFPWLNTPQWWQIHRWRYALPLQSLSVSCLVTPNPLPIVCCGDWCGGNLVESAIHSGFTAADKVIKNLLLEAR